MQNKIILRLTNRSDLGYADSLICTIFYTLFTFETITLLEGLDNVIL